jgi:hypothetical protein
MDSDDEMMLNQFMEEEANAATVEEEHLMILACLLQLRTDELKNTAYKCGGLKFGRKKTKPRQRMEGHAILYADEPTYTPKDFRRQF